MPNDMKLVEELKINFKNETTNGLVAFFMLHHNQHLIKALCGIGPVYHVAPSPAHPLLGDRYVVDSRVIYKGTIW